MYWDISFIYFCVIFILWSGIWGYLGYLKFIQFIEEADKPDVPFDWMLDKNRPYKNGFSQDMLAGLGFFAFFILISPLVWPIALLGITIVGLALFMRKVKREEKENV